MSIAGGGKPDPQGRRNFRVSEGTNPNLGTQFTSAGQVSRKGGIATVRPNTSPEKLAQLDKEQKARQGEAKNRADAAADKKRLGLAKNRYKSALAAGKSHDEAHAIGLKTHKGFKPPSA